QFSTRWTPKTEDRLLAARAADHLAVASIADAASAPTLELTAADWPGFRGPARDGRRPGVRVATDWQAHPPKELWRHLVGPGWWRTTSSPSSPAGPTARACSPTTPPPASRPGVPAA